MSYAELLLSEEWAVRRKKILERDSFQCTNCLNERLINSFRKGVAAFKFDKVLVVIDPDFNKTYGLRISENIQRI